MVLEVCEEGLSLLRSIGSEEVSIVAVAGMYRTGKSFFLNRLAQTSELGVGSTTEPHTRGIWLWSSPDMRARDGSRLLLMDTEGLASADQEESYDVKIFALGLLLSSYFVLNVVGVIDDNTIERLHLVTEVTKRVVVYQDEGKQQGRQDLSKHFPPLVVLVRDFALAPTSRGAAITDAEYLEEALRLRGPDETDPKRKKRHQRRDNIRDALRNLFPRRSCVTLVRPATDEAVLRNAVNVPDAELRPEFVEKMARLREAVVLGGGDGVAPAAVTKMVVGRKCTGAALAELALQHVAAINAGAAPSIAGAWDAASTQICAGAYEEALGAYRDNLGAPPDVPREASRGLPSDDWSDRYEIDQRHRRAMAAAFAEFDKNAVDSDAKTARGAQLAAELDAKGVALLDEMVVRSEAACAAALQALTTASSPRKNGVAPLDDQRRHIVEKALSSFKENVEKAASIARGPARHVFYERLDLHRLVNHVAAKLADFDDGKLWQAKLEASRQVEEATERVATAEKRADERADRADRAERRSSELSTRLADAETELAEARRSEANLVRELDQEKARAAAEREKASRDLENVLCLSYRREIAMDAAARALAGATEATASAIEASSKASTTERHVATVVVASVLADTVATVQARANAKIVEKNHADDLSALAAKIKDETRRSTLDEAEFLSKRQQQAPPLAASLAPIGKLWSAGQQRVASVAERLLQQIDDELGEADDDSTASD